MDEIRALIVDDDPEIGDLLCGYLAGFGVQAEAVGDGAGMRAAMANREFHVVILDLMLPTEGGLSLCRELREAGSIPIIMLTARGETADRVLGLGLGADDYMVKPFEPRELVARIQTVLRRTQSAGGGGAATREIVSFEGWSLNRIARQLITPQKLVVPLSNAEFRLLFAFIEHPRRVLSRDYLIDVARGRSADVFDRSIDLLVSRLRQKLNDDPKSPMLIRTVRGEGYMFDASVQ